MKLYQNISVIIPVYNAEKYVRRAVESAVHFPEVAEVILIEDGSPDNALDVCKQLVKEFAKVQLHQHPGGINKGAGASRNLGIQKATSEFIAFLDADDYYLPNRFDKERDIFSLQPEADGVYGCIKADFQNEDAKKKFLASGKKELTTVTKIIKHNELFDALLFSSFGNFHGNALTIRKKVFDKIGYFDEKLTLSQDTHMWLKMAAKCHLIPGSNEIPIAVRRVHDQNRIHASSEKIKYFKELMYERLFLWAARQTDLPYSKINRTFVGLYLTKGDQKNPIHLLLKLLINNPILLFSPFFYRKLITSILR